MKKFKILVVLFFTQVGVYAQPFECRDCNEEDFYINKRIFKTFDSCLKQTELIEEQLFDVGFLQWDDEEKSEGYFVRTQEPYDGYEEKLESSYDEYCLRHYSAFISGMLKIAEDLAFLKDDVVRRKDKDIRRLNVKMKKTLQSIADIEISLQQEITKRKRDNLIDDLEFYKESLHLTSEEIIKCQNWISKCKKKYDDDFKTICKTENTINQLYLERFDWCWNNHQNLGSLYERGMFNFNIGQNLDCLKDIDDLLQKAKEQNQIDQMQSEILQLKGKCQMELGLYHDAIIALSQAININPDNKEAYFERAGAYFETGNFDVSLKDYILSGKKSDPIDLKLKDMLDFSLGISKGAVEGTAISLQEYIPSMLSSAYGMGECLWAFANEPVKCLQILCTQLSNALILLKTTHLKKC